MRFNKAEAFIILLLGRNPGRAVSIVDIEYESKAYGIDRLKLEQAFNSLEYREDRNERPTGLIRQVDGMGQSGNFGFKLKILGRQAFKVLRGNV